MARPQQPRQQQSIQIFTHLSKPLLEQQPTTRKRKLESDNDSSTLSVALLHSKKRRISLKTPPETPTKPLKRALAELSLTVPTPPLKSVKRKRAASPAELSDAPLTSPTPTPPVQVFELPPQLDDLKRLNSAFLSALALHYAHNGASASVDIRTITPSLTKLWRKRKASAEDIRLCLGVMQIRQPGRPDTAVSKFCLKDYGNGKICIEPLSKGRKRGVIGHHFDEPQLKAVFNERLEMAWQSWTTKSPEGSIDWDAFVDTLPLQPLVVSSTVAKVVSLQAKGQRRLEDVLIPFNKINLSDDPSDRPLKRTKSDQETTSSVVKPALPNAGKENALPGSTATRTLSLLDRIRAKEEYAASLPAAPTKAQRERMAALQHAEELLEILSFLAAAKGGSARVSFSLPALVTNVRSSIRSPMSKEEILRCLQVLSSDVVPGHVNMVTFGSVTGVVVDRSRKPTLADVKAKLKANGV